MPIAVTQHDVRLKLAEEDARDLEAGEIVGVHDDISPGMLIASGLDIEGQQYVPMFI